MVDSDTSVCSFRRISENAPNTATFQEKKQQLPFARFNKRKSIRLADEPSGSSTSDHKLPLGNRGGVNDSATDCATQQWPIIHVAHLNELIRNLVLY